jgi:hypothetical protein
MPVDPYGYQDQIADQFYQDDYRPWWYDLGIEAIRRGAETAQVIGSGYPQFPDYPLPVPPSPVPLPVPIPGVTPTPQPAGGIQLSTNTLMLLVGGVLLFMLGKRGR